jgi:hypothetical protein
MAVCSAQGGNGAIADVLEELGRLRDRPAGDPTALKVSETLCSVQSTTAQ